MRSHVEDNFQGKGQRLAALRNETAELERRLADVRLSLERELAQPVPGRRPAPGHLHAAHRGGRGDIGLGDHAGRLAGPYPVPDLGYGYDDAAGYDGTADEHPADEHPADDHPADDHPADDDAGHSPRGRTDLLVNHGRSTAYRRGRRRARTVAIAATVAALLAAMVLILSSGGASWPRSVATVRREITVACRNPDVRSEPGQVNFACAKQTSQILWVFALMTSSDDPHFADGKTGRQGLEPITPTQGSELAWSLNLHHPYDPTNPIDSLEVAARAVNNIIGGATVTAADGRPVVQPGLESVPANCARYTGSAAVTSRKGFPRLCVRPVTSPAGEAALVADVYQKWVVGAGPRAAHDAAVLFENAKNPGNPQVQAILRHLPGTGR